MKGLVGGIPLALLVAAVANGHGTGHGHGEVADEGPITFFGGPSGDDDGNSAGIRFHSSYGSKVKGTYKDDHSFHLKNTVVTPPPPMHGFRKRGGGDTTFIAGPSGDDGGNEAAIEFDSDYSSAVEDWYKDDHSVDIKNHIIQPPPVPGFRKRGGGDTTLIAGPSGDDGGNSASIKFDSSYASVVEDWYKDDHSLDVENHIVTPPPVYGFRKRGDGGATLISGPSGDDGGNSAEIEFDSSYASSVEDWDKDDHSVDIKNHIIHPPPVPGFRKRQGDTLIGGPSGNDGGNSAEIEFESIYTSTVKDSYKDDHSVDIKNNVIHPPPVPGFRKRYDGGNHMISPHEHKDGDEPVVGHVGKDSKPKGHTLISGPSGADGGGSADIEFDRGYSSAVKGHYKDDHSVDIKNTIIHPPPKMPGFRRRAGGPPMFGGPSGDDEGNSADIEFDSEFSSMVDDHYEDDHSVKEENFIVQPLPPPPPPRPHAPPFGAEPPRPQGPPFGGEPEAPHPQAPPFGAEPEAPRPHAPPFGGEPEAARPVAPASSAPCTTSTFLETIVKTISEKPAPTKPAAPYQQPEHSQVKDPQPSSPSYPAHASEAVPSGVSATNEPDAPKAQHDPGYSKPEPVRPPSTSSKAEAHYQPPAPTYPAQETAHAQPKYSAAADPKPKPQATTTPCPTPKPQGHQPEGHQPEPTAPSYQPHHPEGSNPAEDPKPSGVAPTSAKQLTAITSTITVSRTSSFAVVPVYVPGDEESGCTTAHHQRPSDVDAHAKSEPAIHHATSSATPSHAAKSSHHAGPSATPSHDAMFTGAAGRMAPAAGVVSAVCGLMAVLAFVL